MSKKAKDVAVYGPAGSFDSFRIVAQGLAAGLADNGCDCELVEFLPGEFPDHAGVGAKVGIMCGSGDHMKMLTLGDHCHRACMVAPNSTWLPPQLISAIEEHCTEVLTPSTYGWLILGNYFKTSPIVRLVPHGVVAEDASVDTRVAPDTESVKLLHLAESSTERKGTVELLKALEGEWSKGIHLTIVTSHYQASRVSEMAEERFAGGREVEVVRRWGVSPAVMRAFYRQFDAVVQPSRAEGFGLVPLEALCAGVPAIATLETGHRMWAIDKDVVDGQPLGFVPIKCSAVAPVSYDPTGMAPVVRVTDIRDALDKFLKGKKQWQQKAKGDSQRMVKKWSWGRRTRNFAQLIKYLQTAP